MNIADRLWAIPVYFCEINEKICKTNGKCSDCLTAHYFVTFDDDKIENILKEWAGVD